MSATVYEFRGGKLQPITSQGLTIGQRVRQAHSYEIGVICGEESTGYHVVFEDGSEHHGQRLDCLSPYTRISLVDGIADASEVAALLQKRLEKREQDKLDREAAATKKARDTEQLVKELREQYPWAKTNNPSKNLKKELSIAFPRVKFSVRVPHHGSLNVSWDNGPTDAEVSAIADKYQDGHFDGMTDCHNYDHSAYGEAVDLVLGRQPYVFTNRHFVKGLWEQVCRDIATLQGVDFTSDRQQRPNDSFDLGQYASRALARCSFPVGSEYVGVDYGFRLSLVGACSNDEVYRIVHTMTDEESEMREVIKGEFDYIQHTQASV